MYKRIPFRIIIYLLEYYELDISNILLYDKIKKLYGYFKLDRFKHKFLIFQSICTTYTYDMYKFIPFKIKNLTINIWGNETINYVLCNNFKHTLNINNLHILYVGLFNIFDESIIYDGNNYHNVNNIFISTFRLFYNT